MNFSTQIIVPAFYRTAWGQRHKSDLFSSNFKSENFIRIKKYPKKPQGWLQQQWNVWASKRPRTSCGNTVIPIRESWRSCQQINLWTSGVIMTWTVSTGSPFSQSVNKTRLIMMIIDSKIPFSWHAIIEAAMRQKKAPFDVSLRTQIICSTSSGFWLFKWKWHGAFRRVSLMIRKSNDRRFSNTSALLSGIAWRWIWSLVHVMFPTFHEFMVGYPPEERWNSFEKEKFLSFLIKFNCSKPAIAIKVTLPSLVSLLGHYSTSFQHLWKEDRGGRIKIPAMYDVRNKTSPGKVYSVNFILMTCRIPAS